MGFSNGSDYRLPGRMQYGQVSRCWHLSMCFKPEQPPPFTQSGTGMAMSLPSKYAPCKYPEGSTLPEGTREILGTHRGSIYSPPHMRTTAFHLHWPEHWCGAHFGMKQTNWIRILFPPVEMKRNGFGDHIHVFWIHCAENRADFSLHLVIEPPVSSNISAREIWAMMRRQKKKWKPSRDGSKLGAGYTGGRWSRESHMDTC